MPRFAEVVFPLPLDGTFTYDLPEDSGPVEIGHRVLAPFHNRALTGFVVGFPAEAGEIQTKTIQAVLDEAPILTATLVELARRMAFLYGVSFGEAVQTVLPPGLVRQSRRRVVAGPREDSPEGTEERAFWERVKKSRGLDFVATVRRTPKLAATIRALEKGGWVEVKSVLRRERARVRKGAFYQPGAVLGEGEILRLSEAQVRACGTIEASLVEAKYEPILLHGITGSGKTEIYLQATAKAFELGKSVLALVPEIALTPQFVARFHARFGDRIAVLHSARSESERLTDWVRIRSGEARIVIGARSAVFAPLSNLGLVIVDEEHDGSYKQEEGVLYHARELARSRAETENATIVFGSATPSLEIYEGTRRKEVKLLELRSRVTPHDLPSVDVIDLRGRFRRFGEKGMFSDELREAVAETLGRNEQAILFLNRRGYAPIVLCPSCGKNLRCKNCSVGMTYHEKERCYLCHYCGDQVRAGSPCPDCKGETLIHLGMGTERVEEELHFCFPDARIVRMDRDTVSRKGAHERILEKLAKGEIDILIGTQMVTKGLDLPNVTLVGVILADHSLHFPDFRAAERTFQLLTQVSGRSGRGATAGRAIVQSFQPDHYAVSAAASQDYKHFFGKEIVFREELGYPPFKSLSMIELSGRDVTSVRQAAMWLGNQARRGTKEPGLDVLGPAPAPIATVEGKSRYHLMLRSPRGPLAAAFSRWLVAQARPAMAGQNVSLRLDTDPYRFL